MLVLTSWFLYSFSELSIFSDDVCKSFDDVCKSFDNHIENVYNSIVLHDTTNNSSNINQKVENWRGGLNNWVTIIMFLVSIGGFATDIKTGFNITFDTEDESKQDTKNTSPTKKEESSKEEKTLKKIKVKCMRFVNECWEKIKKNFPYIVKKIVHEYFIPTLVVLVCDFIFCLLFWLCHNINTQIESEYIQYIEIGIIICLFITVLYAISPDIFSPYIKDSGLWGKCLVCALGSVILIFSLYKIMTWDDIQSRLTDNNIKNYGKIIACVIFTFLFIRVSWVILLGALRAVYLWHFNKSLEIIEVLNNLSHNHKMFLCWIVYNEFIGESNKNISDIQKYFESECGFDKEKSNALARWTLIRLYRTNLVKYNSLISSDRTFTITRKTTTNPKETFDYFAEKYSGKSKNHVRDVIFGLNEEVVKNRIEGVTTGSNKSLESYIELKGKFNGYIYYEMNELKKENEKQIEENKRLAKQNEDKIKDIEKRLSEIEERVYPIDTKDVRENITEESKKEQESDKKGFSLGSILSFLNPFKSKGN